MEKMRDCHLVVRTCDNEVGVAISIRDPYTSPFTSRCKFAFFFCLQTCNVAASEEIVGERCVPSLIVINSTINKLESKVSLITTHCLRLFVVVYKFETL